MRVALINGSPKVKESASGALLEDLKCYFTEKAEVVEVGAHADSISEKVLEELKASDVWVIACPLYVDGIPAHLLSCMVQLEKENFFERKIHVYGIINCGFFEGIQAELALDILRNWGKRAGLDWCGGIGIGGGGGLAMMPKMQPGQGPKAPIDKALEMLAQRIFKHEVKENVYVSVAFPRFLYKMGAQVGWRQMIKANGGKKSDLKRRPE